MPGDHKPLKVSQSVVQRNGGKYPVLGNGHRCPKSPSGGHWWRIGSPDGALSVGVCRYCGERRQFANSLKVALSSGVKR